MPTLESRPLFSNRQLFQLIWPLVIEQLLNVLVGMVDVVMVASIGEAAVSGVSLVDSLNMLLIQFLAALTSGGTVVAAQFIGMKNEEKANSAAGQLVLLTIVSMAALSIGFLLSGTKLLALIFGQVDADVMRNAHTYFVITTCSFPFLALYNSCAALFRAQGNSRISMNTSMLMNGLNVVGNALCIYLLKMGVSGVAIPTLVSRVVASLLLFHLLQNGHGIRVPHLRQLRPDKAIILRILHIGIPGGVENSVFHLGKLMLQSLISTLGTAAIAGFAVASNLVNFLYLPGGALGLALTTVVGQCIGAGEVEQAKKYTWKFIGINYAFLAVLATSLLLCRNPFIGIYNLSAEAAEVASGLVFSHCLAMAIWPLAFTTPHALRAAYDATFTMVSSIACIWIFRVALAYLFVRGFGLSIQYVWYAMYVDWFVRVFIYLHRMKGFEKRIQKAQF